MPRKRKAGRARKGSGRVRPLGPGRWEVSLAFTVAGKRRDLSRVVEADRASDEAIDSALDELKAERQRQRDDAKARPADAPALPRGHRSFGSVCDAFLAAQRDRLKGATIAFYALHLDHARAQRENLDVARFDRAKVLELLQVLDAAGASLRTRQAVFTSLKVLFKFAFAQKWISRDPMAADAASQQPPLQRPGGSKQATKKGPSALRYYEAAELRRFIATAWEVLSPTRALFLELVAETGVRSGEALGLSWGCVDIEGRQIRIERQLEAGGDFSLPKWGSVRTLKISAALADKLERYRPDRANRDRLVFCSRDDPRKPMQRRNVRRSMQVVAERAGLPYRTLHELRHSAATLQLSAGVPLRTVSERLGHRDSSTTLKVYAHAIPLDQDRATEAMERALRGE